MWIIFFLFVWTVASVGYIVCNLGNKNMPGPDPWWVWVLGAPALVLASIIGWLGSLGRK